MTAAVATAMTGAGATAGVAAASTATATAVAAGVAVDTTTALKTLVGIAGAGARAAGTRVYALRLSGMCAAGDRRLTSFGATTDRPAVAGTGGPRRATGRAASTWAG